MRRSVSSLGGRLLTVALVVFLLAPNALATDVRDTNPSLWAEFIAWLNSRVDNPDGFTAQDDWFTVWLMGRISIPGG